MSKEEKTSLRKKHFIDQIFLIKKVWEPICCYVSKWSKTKVQQTDKQTAFIEYDGKFKVLQFMASGKSTLHKLTTLVNKRT